SNRCFTVNGCEKAKRLKSPAEGKPQMINGTRHMAPIHFDTTDLVRRTFLKFVGVAAITHPGSIRGQANAPPTKNKESVMEIKRVGSQASTKGPAEWFTGTVRIDPLLASHDPARAAVASVT